MLYFQIRFSVVSAPPGQAGFPVLPVQAGSGHQGQVEQVEQVARESLVHLGRVEQVGRTEVADRLGVVEAEEQAVLLAVLALLGLQAVRDIQSVLSIGFIMMVAIYQPMRTFASIQLTQPKKTKPVRVPYRAMSILLMHMQPKLANRV